MNYYNNVFIGIGSNTGNAKENCLNGINRLKEATDINIVNCSSFYRTEPVGGPDQDWFVNCALEAKTLLSPLGLLSYLQNLEHIIGRVRSIKWGPRIIDFDILFFNNEIVNKSGLKIPHPLNHKRRFVLEPMGEIAPSLIHPALNKSIEELKMGLNAKEQKIELLI